MLWTLGAVLLAVVVVKLFAIDLAALRGLTRVVAFMGVGLLLLVIGYVAPLPPATSGRPAQESASSASVVSVIRGTGRFASSCDANGVIQRIATHHAAARTVRRSTGDVAPGARGQRRGQAAATSAGSTVADAPRNVSSASSDKGVGFGLISTTRAPPALAWRGSAAAG